MPHSDLEAPPRQSFMVLLALIFLLCICHEMSVWNLLGVQSTLQACDTGMTEARRPRALSPACGMVLGLALIFRRDSDSLSQLPHNALLLRSVLNP